MRRADPLRVAEAQLTGALHRLAAVGPDDADAMSAVDEATAKISRLGGDPDSIRHKVDQVLAERLALVLGAKYSALRPRMGFNP